MSRAEPSLDLATARAHISDGARHARCNGDTGIELEWITSRPGARDERLSPDAIDRFIALTAPTLPRRSALTIEPGGQLELSCAPQPDAALACRAAGDDLFVLDQACQQEGFELVAMGSDPSRTPRRIVDSPRYSGMQAYFDRDGHWGRTMMCNTASLQLNVGLGHGADAARRWRTAHRIGPAMVAAFANSPFDGGGPTGWASSRMRVWFGIDPTHCRPVDPDRPAPEAWADFALDAHVMMIHRDGEAVLPESGFTFGDWLRDGHRLGPATIDDLNFHLTTLFPPVRPRGWLEIRYLDSLPTPYWQTAVAVVGALLDAEKLAGVLDEATAESQDRWVQAARDGLSDPALASTASALFDLAAAALRQSSTDPVLVALVESYRDEFVGRGRTPADYQLNRWRTTGDLVGPAESPVDYTDLARARQ